MQLCLFLLFVHVYIVLECMLALRAGWGFKFMYYVLLLNRQLLLRKHIVILRNQATLHIIFMCHSNHDDILYITIIVVSLYFGAPTCGHPLAML